ncbi:MAG: hypothetical protein M3530_11135, partial [Thermoproteota archaeon]|nr:hypothetical protein [Thermoproteota archaeon]
MVVTFRSISPCDKSTRDRNSLAPPSGAETESGILSYCYTPSPVFGAEFQLLFQKVFYHRLN